MIARAGIPLVVGIAIVACASIDPPAAFVPNDAEVAPSSDDGGRYAGCKRVLPRIFSSDATATVYGAPDGPQAVCVTLDFEVESAGPGLVTFCVAGDLDTASIRRPRDIGLDPDRCAYCADVRINCVETPDGGVTAPCKTEYAPIAGTTRILRLGRNAGDDVWIDVGALVVARVDARDGGVPILQRADCFFADGLTFQGKLVAATCAPDDTSAECRIAASAASRFP